MYDPNEDTDPTSLQPPSFVLVPLNAAAKRAVEHRRNQYYLHYMDEGTQGLWIAFDGDKGSYTLGNGEGSDIYLPETRTNKGSAQIDALHAEFTLIADQGAVLLVNHSGDLTRTTTFTIPNRGPSSTVPIDEESQSVLVARGINPCIALGNNRLFQFEIRWYTPGLYAFDPIEPYVLGPRRSAQKRYLQGQRIGGGSSSTVWTALDCRLGSVIVVKKFNNLAGPGRKQLAREAEIFRRGSASGSAKPRHDHILEILDILTDRNTDWLEFLLPLKQCDLRTLVEQDAGSIGEEVSDTVLRQMLLALECLHEHSMTHGNLRPEKVFCEYDEDGNLNLYLCPQFGRQPYLHGKERSLFTAPEVSHKKKQTIKSDMWSLFSMVCWIRNEDGFRFNANKLSGNQIHHWINFLAKKEAFSRIRGMAESNPKKRPSPSEQLQRLDDIQEFGEEENEGDEFAREEEEEEEEEGLLEEGDDEEGSNKSSAYPYYEPYTSPLPDTYARYPTYEPYTTKLIDDEDNMEASSSLQAAAYDSDDLTEAPSMWIQEPPLDVEVASSGKGKGKRREFVGAPLRKEPATASHGPEPSEEADWVHVAKLPLAKSIADLDGNPVSLKSSTPPPEAAGKGKGKGKGKEVSGTKLATAPAAPPKKQSGSGSQERHGPGAAASAPDKPAVKRSVDLDGASSPLKPFTFPPEVAVTGEISGGRVASGPPQKEPFEGSSDLDGLQEETERVTKPPPAKPTADSDDDLVPVESSIPPPMAPVKEGQGKETFGTPLQKEPAAGSQGPDGLEEDTERVTKTPPLTSTADLDENSDTLGSSASLLGVAGPVAVLLLQPFFKNFLQFVAEEPNLSSLYKQAVNIVNERDFEAHLNQLLEAYGRSLGDEAQTPMQKETASLVQRSATQVVRTIKKGIISREEEYRTGETVGTHQEQDIDSVGETATRLARDDTKDGNGDDEVSSLEEEYQRLSQDAGFEEFLTSTQAFDTLFESIKTWLGTNRQREEVSMVALRVEMSSQRFGLQRGLIPASADSPSEREIDEVYSPVDLVRWFKEAAELTHGTKGPDPNEYTTLRRTQTFWSVQSEDSSEGEGGISASEDGLVEREMPGGFPDDAADDLELDDESAGEGVLGFKLIAAFARWIHEPRLLPGYKRLRWRCSCGKTLFGDFADDNPVALSDLARRLQTMTANGTTPSESHRPQGSPRSESSGSTSRSLANTTDTSQTGSSRNSDSTLAGASNTPGISTACQPHQPHSGKAYFELCANVGPHAIRLTEIDISTVRNDAEFFDRIWSRYKSLRGSWFKRVFLKPEDIHFVYFGVRHRHQAGIYRKPIEIPPELEVHKQRYHYYECPIEVLPPMPSNVFLHYLSCARERTWLNEIPGAHGESFFFQRLPKKTQHSIFEELLGQGMAGVHNGVRYGWGVHIIEGPDHATLSIALGLGVAVGFIVSVLIVGFAQTQEQGFGIGQWVVGVISCIMAALYFRLVGH